MITTSTSNQSACQRCGCFPSDQYRRTQAARDASARYAKLRSNWRRADKTYWDHYGDKLRGTTFVPGQLLCPQCYGEFSRILNA